jgi:hypothetical protein
VVTAVTQPVRCTAAFAAGGFTCIPAADSFGADSVASTIAEGGLTDTATVNMDVQDERHLGPGRIEGGAQPTAPSAPAGTKASPTRWAMAIEARGFEASWVEAS